MTRAVITGVGCVGPAGTGSEPLREALGRGAPLGSLETIETLRGRAREMRLARIPSFDREAWIPARRLRRMGNVSQVWTIACLLARADARLEAEPASSLCAPERRGTWLGTGYGCTDTTWDYLLGMFRDGAGMANPFLFSESVANAPAGHSAIELDTRGAGATLTCGDASAATALELAARAIREGRVDLAWCGGVEIFSAPLLRVLAGVGAPAFLGEGAVCLTLESLASAHARGARVYAEVAAGALLSDPEAPPSGWGRDRAPIAAAMRRALDRARSGAAEPAQGRAARVRKVHLHAPGAPEAEEAERAAAASVCPDVETAAVSRVVGALAAAGGFSLAAAALEMAAAPEEARPGDLALVSAMSWGGGIASIALRRAPA